MMGAQLCEYIKAIELFTLKWANYVVCKSQIFKAIFKKHWLCSLDDGKGYKFKYFSYELLGTKDKREILFKAARVVKSESDKTIFLGVCM